MRSDREIAMNGKFPRKTWLFASPLTSNGAGVDGGVRIESVASQTERMTTEQLDLLFAVEPASRLSGPLSM